MRKMILSLVVGGGLVAATVVPALACMYNTQATNQQQQTAQAQPSDVKTQ